MNILVTGSNGFVGRAIIESLKKNHYVIGIGTKNIPTNKVDKYVKWDIAKDKLPESAISEKVDIIIHAAACIDIKDQELELTEVNCLGTQRIFNLAVEKNVEKVFYISSAPVIGTPEFHPISEKQYRDNQFTNTIACGSWGASKLNSSIIYPESYARGGSDNKWRRITQAKLSGCERPCECNKKLS